MTSTALVISFQCFSRTCCKKPLNNNSSPKGATITTAVNNKKNPVMLSGCKSQFGGGFNNFSLFFPSSAGINVLERQQEKISIFYFCT